MNFFEHQARARSTSRWLVVLFLLALVAISLAVGAVVALAVGASVTEEGTPTAATLEQASGAFVIGVVATLAVILIASLFKSARLRAGGGSAVARSLGGTRVSPDTGDFKMRRLRNVVEEIAIASGVPVPAIYVLEKEPGINAFAAGYTPANAAVAVTRGCLDKLTRDELQGVIAHEFSHVVNGDMRVSIRLMGVVFGLLVIHIIGREVMDALGRGRIRSGSKKGDPTAAILLIALALMILGAIGMFFGRLIKAAVSRQRETLADASAVQFTRQTAGLAGALKKIAGIDAGSKLQVNGEEVSHMLFGDGVGFSSLFATHPPIEQRIKTLEPGFNLRLIEKSRELWNSSAYEPEDDRHPEVSRLDAGASLQIAALTPQVGEPRPEDFARAEALHQALPTYLLAAAHGENAQALLMALLLHMDQPAGAPQLAYIESTYGKPVRVRVQKLGMRLAGLHPAQRLPLASIAMASLRSLPREQLVQLLKAITYLVNSDKQIAVFEYCLSRLLRDQLAEVLHPAASRTFGDKNLVDCRASAQALLTVVAQQGHAEDEAARKAYFVGMQQLLPREVLAYRRIDNWPPELDAALADLDQLKPQATAPLVDALLAVLSDDGQVTVAEVELLRVICAALHCPLPPLLGAAKP